VVPYAHFDFPFENLSAHPVQIDTIRTTCGCTVVQLVNRTILPHGKGVLPVDMRVQLAGKSTQQVAITVKGGKAPAILQCEAFFDPKVQVQCEPANVVLEAASASVAVTISTQTRPRDITVAATSSETAVTATVGKVTYSRVMTIGSHWEAWFVVEVACKDHLKAPATVKLTFSDPAFPAAAFTVRPQN
jgi:hypothetical protein